jgi:hypothetical protein
MVEQNCCLIAARKQRERERERERERKREREEKSGVSLTPMTYHPE